jgi:hypothetical protein
MHVNMFFVSLRYTHIVLNKKMRLCQTLIQHPSATRLLPPLKGRFPSDDMTRNVGNFAAVGLEIFNGETLNLVKSRLLSGRTGHFLPGVPFPSVRRDCLTNKHYCFFSLM